MSTSGHILKALLATTSVLFAAGSAAGQLHQGDVILFRDLPSGDVVRTGGASGLSAFPARVFPARFADTGFVNRTTNPGFNAIPEAFFTGATTGVSINRAVRKWSGGNLCTIPTERITLTKLGISAVSPTVDPPSGTGPSVTLGFTDPTDGGFHEHGAFALGTPFGSGVYVLEMTAWVGSPMATSPLPSEPFWVVFSQNAPAQEQADCIAYLIARGANSSGTTVSLCPCAADFDGSGDATVQDVFAFLNAWFAGDVRTDLDGDGVNVQDIFLFLNTWFAGCA